jgi:hypothetical protein
MLPKVAKLCFRAVMTEENQHKLTWLAVILTFILLIPSLFVGGVMTWVYFAFLGILEDGTFLGWLTNGFFDLLILSIIPNFAHGVIGGAIALWVSTKELKHANYEIVAYTVSGIVVAFAVLGLIGGYVQSGVGWSLVELASNTVGIVLGLFWLQFAQRGRI